MKAQLLIYPAGFIFKSFGFALRNIDTRAYIDHRDGYSSYGEVIEEAQKTAHRHKCSIETTTSLTEPPNIKNCQFCKTQWDRVELIGINDDWHLCPACLRLIESVAQARRRNAYYDAKQKEIENR